MSVPSQALQNAAAAKIAASLGVTNMNLAEIAEMLKLKYSLFPMFQVSVAFLILTWIAVLLRIYTRAIVLKSFGWDDGLMMVAQAVFSCTCACLITIEAIERGGSAKLALQQGIMAQFPLLERIFQLVMGFMALYIITTVVLKLSLAIFFLRVIPSGWQRKALYAFTGVYTSYGVFFTFIVIFQCGNPGDFFLQEARGKCISDDVLQPLYYVAGGMNALTDWVFSVLPLTVLWSAAIPRSTKISAACLLGLGSLASISSLIRLAYIPGIKASPTFLEGAVNIASWSIVEPGLGIIAASLATLRPLFRWCFPGPRSTVLPTTHKGKPITYTPGTYVSRLSFEDKISPYGKVQWGSVTTVVGNSRELDVTELQDIGRPYDKKLEDIEESPRSPGSSRSSMRHSRNLSALSRADSGSGNRLQLQRSTSQKSLMRHERHQFPWPPNAISKKAHISKGRVVMSKDIRLEQEISVDRSPTSSPL